MLIAEIKSNFEFDAEEIHLKAKEATNLLVDQCYRYYDSTLFEFSVPASRNLYQSHVYHHFYNFFMMSYLWTKHDIDIEVDSFSLYQVLKIEAKRQRKSVKITFNFRQQLVNYIKPFFRLFVTCKRMFMIKSEVKKFGLKISDLKNKEDLVFVDTNLAEGFYSSDGYKDRYYGSFFDQLGTDLKNRLVLLPNFSATTDFSLLRSQYEQYSAKSGIFLSNKENFLDFSDYIKIIFKLVGSLFLSLKSNPVPYSSFIKEELYLKAFSTMSFESFVTYYFLKKESFNSLSVQTIMIWYENHLYDRAYFKAYNEVKPNYKLKAYQQIMDLDYEFFMEPTQEELTRGLNLSKRLVVGENHVPFYRLAKYINHQEKYKDIQPASNRVLVCLSLVPSLAEAVMAVVGELAKVYPKYEFVIRCHPLLKVDLPPSLSNVLYDVESDIVKSMKSASFFVGTTSVTVLEAALVGLPTLIVYTKGEPVQNQIPKPFRDLFTTVINNESDFKNIFAEVISKVNANQTERVKASEQMYQNFIEPISKNKPEDIVN